MDSIYESIVSTIDQDYQSKKDMSLSSFTKKELSKSIIDKYKSDYRQLSHVRINKNTKGYVWLDGNSLVGFINVEDKDGEKWINSFEIFGKYKKHGLSKQIMNVAMRNLKATHLSVNKKNNVAIKIYKSIGFNTYKETDTMLFMSINESYIEESSKYPEEVPDEIIDLLKRLNSYDYGYIKNGKKVKGMKNFFEDYKSLTISEFEKYEIGVCWDYVHYEAYWFNKHGYRYETFYIQVQDKDNDCPSHTYLAFYLANSSKVYYFESSWGKYQGIEEFDNINELHETIKDRHISSARSKCDPKTYFRNKYDAKSSSWEHLGCGEYMVKVSKGRIQLNESYIEESKKDSEYSYSSLSSSKDIADFNRNMQIVFKSKNDMSKEKTHKSMKAIKFNGEIIGYIGFSRYNIDGKKYLGIGNFMIIPKYQSSGHGTKIIKDLIDRYKDTYDEIYCYVEKENKNAIRFYKRIADVNTKNLTKYGYYVCLYRKGGSSMNESNIINQKDIYYNKDKFDSGEINLCFITGHSGSGKSTMARSMQNSKVEHYELDDLNQNYKFTDENLKEYGDLIYSFFKGPGKKYRYHSYESMQNCTNPLDDSGDEFDKCVNRDFVKYAMKYANSHKNTKFVIEGIWLYFFFKPEELKDYAVYIKGTSRILSAFRAAKRDSKDANTKPKRFIYSIKGTISTLYNKYSIEGEKLINKYRDYYGKLEKVDESYIEESIKTKNQIGNKETKDIQTVISSLDDDSFNDFKFKDIVYCDIRYKSGKPIAFITIRTKLVSNSTTVGYVSLAVDPKYQKQGIGKSLTEKAVSWFKQERGIHFLEWHCLQDNEASRKLANSAGFREYIAKSEDEYAKFTMESYVEEKLNLLKKLDEEKVSKEIFDTVKPIILTSQNKSKVSRLGLDLKCEITEVDSGMVFILVLDAPQDKRDTEEARSLLKDLASKCKSKLSDIVSKVDIGDGDEGCLFFTMNKGKIRRKRKDLLESYTEESSKYDRPYSADEIKKNYGIDVYDKLVQDPIHKYRMDSGIELVHKVSSNESLIEEEIENEFSPTSFVKRSSLPAKNQKNHARYLRKKAHSNKTNNATAQNELPKYNQIGELYVEEVAKSVQVKPIFIVTSYTNTPFGKAIKTFTHSEYTHAAISFDTSLEKLYSFNADSKYSNNGYKGGISRESLSSYIDSYEKTIIQVNCIFLKPSDFDIVQRALDNLLENEEKTKYAYSNIINILIGRAKDTGMAMVCSQFVAYILHTANIELLDKPDNTVTPKDLSTITNPRVYKIFEGYAKDYEKKRIDRIFRKLKTKALLIKESLLKLCV